MSTESDSRQADWEKAERELQRYLGGDSPLSEKYRAQSREITPPQLDSAVLAHAQQQLQSAFATNRGQFVRRRNRRWTIPLATAATMLVGVNLVWQLRDQAVPDIAGDAAVGSLQRSAPMSAPAPSADIEMETQREEPAVAEMRTAEVPAADSEIAEDLAVEEMRQQKAERAVVRAAPAEAAPADAGAAPAVVASAAPAPAPAAQAMQSSALADAASAPKAKRAPVVEQQAARSAERLAPQALQRADGAPPPRERKAMAAASGFAAAPAPPAAAVASAPVAAENPAQAVARRLLRQLRALDVAAVRIDFNAADLGSDMLNAAAHTAAALTSDVQITTDTAGDGLWRFDFRDASQGRRMTAMLQQSGSEWTLLTVDSGGD